MSDLHHELHPRRIEHYRTEAKALLRAARDGDNAALERARAALGERADTRFVLADALHVVAVEHGYRSWPVFKHDEEARDDADVRTVGRISAAPAADYAARAEELLDAARRRDAAAIARLQARVPRLSDLDAADIAVSATDADARICLAREYGFRTWAELVESTDRAAETHYSLLPEESPWKQAATAIQAGDAGRLRELLDEHPSLEHDDPGMTLLSGAAQPEAGSVSRDVVDVLIEAGSELDVPLNLAACFDKADLVGWLLDAGADAAATPIWGITPLQTATYHGSREAVDLLVARTGVIPDAFYLAAATGDVERLDVWFSANGELRPVAMRDRPNLADVGWPPQPPLGDDPAAVLAEALSLAAQLGRTGVCAALLDRGADPARSPLYGITPLHFAASMGRRDTIELLISRGAPLDVPDSLHHGTPLDWARHEGHSDEVMTRLLSGS